MRLTAIALEAHKIVHVYRKSIHSHAETIFYQINYTLTDVPADAAYFHAQFRRTNPLPYKDVYTILDGVRGHPRAKRHYPADRTDSLAHV